MNARQSRHKRPEQAPSISRKRDPPPPEETAQKKHNKSKPKEEPHGLHDGRNTLRQGASRLQRRPIKNTVHTEERNHQRAGSGADDISAREMTTSRNIIGQQRTRMQASASRHKRHRHPSDTRKHQTRTHGCIRNPDKNISPAHAAAGER